MGLAAGSPEALLSRVYHADVSWPVLLGSAIGFGLLLHLFSGGTMSQVQSGILPEHCRAAIWIEANVKGEVDALRIIASFSAFCIEFSA